MNDRDAEDAILLAAVARGEADAFEAFYERFARPLYALGLRWLGQPADAEELVSETLTRAWHGAGRFDAGRGSAASWLFGIAHNVARDRWRADARRATEPLDGLTEGALAGGPADDEAERLVDALDVGLALTTLTAEHREVLILTYAHRATEAEIARRTGIAPGTVKSRRFYALRELAGRLAPPTGDIAADDAPPSAARAGS